MRGSRALRRGRAGYSLLEMLIVLAILAIAAVLIFPRGAAMTDRVLAHAVFFDLQRQLADLRREAFEREAPLLVLSSGAAARTSGERVIPLRTSWSYRLDRPLAISDGGACARVNAELLNGGRVVMRLRTDGSSCRLTRLG